MQWFHRERSYNCSSTRGENMEWINSETQTSEHCHDKFSLDESEGWCTEHVGLTCESRSNLLVCENDDFRMCRGEEHHRCDNVRLSATRCNTYPDLWKLVGIEIRWILGRLQYRGELTNDATSVQHGMIWRPRNQQGSAKLLGIFAARRLPCKQGELHGSLWGSNVQISEDMLDNVDESGASHMLLQ